MLTTFNVTYEFQIFMIFKWLSLSYWVTTFLRPELCPGSWQGSPSAVTGLMVGLAAFSGPIFRTGSPSGPSEELRQWLKAGKNAHGFTPLHLLLPMS